MSDGQDASVDSGRRPARREFSVEELRRRNPSAVSMDVLYLFTTGFFGVLLVKGFRPTLIAALPLAALLYFGWRSSRAFFLAQVVAVAAAAAASRAGLVPI
jgi:hypothetical protein